MKIKIICLYIALLVSGAIHGQATALRLSYCDGEIAETGSLGQAGAQWVSAATFFPAETLDRFSGNEISSIRAGLSSKLNIDTLTVWVREQLDGENLASGTILKEGEQSIVKGWNEIALDEAVAVTGDKGLYVGYSFKQKGASYAISSLDINQENGLFVKYGDNEWENMDDKGVLSIEAMVTGDNLPQYDLAVVAASTKDSYALNTELPVTVTVRNMASCTVTGFDIICSIDGISPYVAHFDSVLEYDDIKTVELSFVPELDDVADRKEMTVSVENIVGGSDEDLDNNICSLAFEVVSEEFVRNILVEEFTTEMCPNCPRGSEALHSAIASDDLFADRVIVACHHSGYYTDWLTTPADNSYLWLFNDGGNTYAPAFMIDRTVMEGEVPVFSSPGGDGFESLFYERLNTPSYVYLEMDASYNSAAGTFTVNVEGRRSREFCDTPPRITVYALENNIKAHGQAGSNGEYIHQHVLRAYNSVWGDVIEWNDDAFEYSCVIELKSSWVVENMQLVAFVSGYDSKDPNNCSIENTVSLDFSEVKGLSETCQDELHVFVSDGKVCTTSDSAMVEVYSVDGVRLDNESLGRGIYIVRITSDNMNFSRKVFVK